MPGRRYAAWRAAMEPAEAERWTRAGGGATKYYKGLGTSSAQEASSPA